MIPDPILEGMERGWQVHDGATMDADRVFETDVAIVGTGAGGGIAAEVLTNAGLKVVLIEEGPLMSSSRFDLTEGGMYPKLYQESASRKTMDKAVNVLQGRCVGGGTTVNWTSSFDTPSPTLEHWGKVHGAKGCSPEDMKPWFAKIDERLGIKSWEIPPNQNNDLLRRGCEALGWSFGVMRRNVVNCANLGYCGMGCPINAKQSMLTTTLPAVLDKGAVLISRTRADRFMFNGDRISELQCLALDDSGNKPSGRRITIKARHFVSAGGAIGSPALLKRSKTPNPSGFLGKRTFLHPVNGAFALFPDPVNGFSGAPQSIYSDHFLWEDGVDGAMGYKLEVTPMHPMLVSTATPGFGSGHASFMKAFDHMQCVIALGRDGFHPESQGGTVHLRDDGSPVLDYPLTPYIWESVKRSLHRIVELQFAAGADRVLVLHRDLREPFTSWDQARKELPNLNHAPLRTSIFSAHVMGGCMMGEDPATSVVNSMGAHHQLENLSVLDGSVFPTSIGANPQVSIYGMTLKNATALAQTLTTGV